VAIPKDISFLHATNGLRIVQLGLPQIDHIFDRVRCSLVSHCSESSATDEPLPSSSLSRDPSQADESTHGTPYDRPVQAQRPMSALIAQLGDAKAAHSTGQLRLVNPCVPQMPAEQVGGLGIAFDRQRPTIRTSNSDGLPGTGNIDQVSSEDRQSRRVSFAGYDSTSPSPPEITATSQYVLTEGEPMLSANGAWHHDTKDAPPPYHPVHKRARSGEP
jgi:hypothetical protein